MRPTICTFRGIEFPPLTPRVDLIDWRDIAHALALQSRFAGHTSQFYSVAQHSVSVSLACDHEDAAHGLLHDAAEAYLTDIPTPIKQLFPGYHAAEARLLGVIFEAFGLSPDRLTTASVIEADQQALQSERWHLMPEAPWWPKEQVPPLPWGSQMPLAPEAAESLFQDRLLQLHAAGLLPRLPTVKGK